MAGRGHPEAAGGCSETQLSRAHVGGQVRQDADAQGHAGTPNAAPFLCIRMTAFVGQLPAL